MPLIFDCLDKLEKAGQIDKDTALKAKRLYLAARDGLAGDMGSSVADAAAALKAAEAIAEGAMQKQYQAALNGLRLADAAERVTNDPHSRRAGAVNLMARFETGKGSPGGVNIDGMTQVYEGAISKPFNQAIEAYGSRLAGLRKDTVGPRNMVRELFGVSTGDEIAAAAAKGWSSASEKAVGLAKSVGRVFTGADDWRIPQFWSTDRVRSIGVDAFKTDILDGIADGSLFLRDPATGEAARGARIKEILDASSEKIHVGTGDASNGGAGAFNSDMRIFKFADGAKGAEAWLHLQGKYGGGQDVMSLLNGHIRSQARDIALADVLGPSSRANWDAVKRLVAEEDAEKAKAIPFLDRVKALRPKDIPDIYTSGILSWFGTQHGLDRLYSVASGKADAISSTMWGGAFGAAKHGLIASQMGGALVSSVAPDSWTAAMAANHLGMDAGKMVSTLLKEFAADIASGSHEAKELLAQLGLVAHASADAALNVARYADQRGVAETMSKLSTFVIRAQGLQAWDEALRRAFTLEFSGFMARQSERAFADLAPEFRGFLGRYRFTETEWEGMRATPHAEMGGARYFDFDAMADETLSKRLKNAMLDERRFAAPGASILERSLVADIPKGTFLGEVSRSMMMYKTFPTWVLLTHLNRAMAQASQGAGGYMAGLAIGLTFMGMLSMQAKELLKGNDPRALNRVDTWAAAAAQGGGAGIFGDFLNSAVSRGGTNFTETAAGPLLGAVGNTVRMFSSNASKEVQGQPATWGASVTDFLRRYTPGSSLWYTRLATDRLVWDQVQKMTDPQWGASFQRRRDKLRTDWGQRSWWDKGQTAPARAPDMAAVAGH